MDTLLIRGGRPLHGVVPVSGAKNASLPILIATVVAPGEHRLQNVPDLVDTSSMLSLLGRIGCPSLVGDTTRVDTSRVAFCEAPYDLVRKMRASVLALGPLLARCGEAHVSLPGGCAIGVRPIDQHLKGLEALGCRFDLEGGYVHGRVDKLRGAEFRFDLVTVTGTENVLMAAVLAEGTTVLENAAAEPEVEDLAKFLSGCGARIEGAGTSRIVVHGVSSLRPSPQAHRILPDRIEAGTYLVAGVITRGNVRCEGASASDLAPVLEVLRNAGAEIDHGEGWVSAGASGRVRPFDITTAPHPGFPTDMQAQVMSLASLALGTSSITETIFENRFMHVAELMRLGARVHIDGRTATVTGQPCLSGATVMATDLRASASLVLAGLAAEGTTEILRLYHLDRGYERLVEKLSAVGASVMRGQEGRPNLAVA
ncbi:MAG: UDP-N-acetylglucosamine 1-carboxyvinyltransferase [Deltaproteobacteria bacterium]|nr:UDP-N-acetylglucosamine 1-carboxyvinyltransferase [Deltaproteobacteria bacterium]